MNKTVLVAALAAGVSIAVPVGAGFAQNAAAPMAPAAAVPAGGSAAMPMSGGGPMMGSGPMMGGGPMMLMRRRMMMGMHRGNPQEWCIDRLAWHAARLAYIETKLELTAAQRPLWAKVEEAARAEREKERGICQSMKSGTAATALDRMDRAEEFLAARLDGLRAARPAVAALYQSLTAEQRAVLDHPFGRS